MTFKSLFTIVFFVGSLLVISALDADAARRFGGGKSFGSKPSMQRSTTAPKQQNPAVTQGAPSAAAQATKPGLLGGMGGMFGGLLAGTLLGSLLFGGPFSGGGIMDLLLIAIVLYFGFKLFARMRGGQRVAQSPAGAGASAQTQGPMQYQAQGDEQNNHAWGNLKQGEAAFSKPAGPPVPEGFDIEEFIQGAKLAFNRLQDSWDKRDLDDIALFTSEAVQSEVKKQLEEDSEQSKTEILLIEAQLLSVKEENDEQRATVYFDVLMRESSSPDTMQVREVWHFVRAISGGSWKLDGIQQVEA